MPKEILEKIKLAEEQAVLLKTKGAEDARKIAADAEKEGGELIRRKTEEARALAEKAKLKAEDEAKKLADEEEAKVKERSDALIAKARLNTDKAVKLIKTKLFGDLN